MWEATEGIKIKLELKIANVNYISYNRFVALKKNVDRIKTAIS